MTQQDKRKKQESKRKQSNEILKYSGLGMQLMIAVFLGAFIGKKLDAHFQTEKPVFTAVLALVFLCVVMYTVLKDLINPK